MGDLLDYLRGAWFDIVVILLMGALVYVGYTAIFAEKTAEPVDHRNTNCVGTAYEYNCTGV